MFLGSKWDDFIREKYDLKNGVRVNDWDSELVIEATEWYCEFDVYKSNASWHLLSKKAIDILLKNGVNQGWKEHIQCLPVRTLHQDGTPTKTEYQFVNFLKCVDLWKKYPKTLVDEWPVFTDRPHWYMTTPIKEELEKECLIQWYWEAKPVIDENAPTRDPIWHPVRQEWITFDKEEIK